MKTNRALSVSISREETIWGWVYLAFQLLLLPSILSAVNGMLPHAMSSAELNFLFFLLNFLAILWIFHSFLGKSAGQVRQHPAYFCQAVILGLAAYVACSVLITWLIRQAAPGYVNANDASIASMSQGSFFLMAVGTVILVPPVEECLYRGLVFRNLYGRSHWMAYAVSILVFAAVHILGYIGTYSPAELALSFLQYLPAGLCLAWSYTKADTIFAPILMHAIINACGIAQMR